VIISPQELARLLEVPEPTPEQARVICAPLAPMAVVAGAGSGKSETMAARVVWLVAGGYVRPERVLGLTFTRKAAAELSDRVRRRLDQLREKVCDERSPHHGLIEPSVFDGEPTVSTYHAYAARLFGDHALREALEPTMRLISPAVAWQIASRVVDSYNGPMDEVEWAPDTVTKAVMELAGELSEHLRSTADVRRVGAWLDESFASVKKPIKLQKDILETQAVRQRLLPLVEGYQQAKARREVIDYGDQMALAARIAARHSEVGVIERSRYGVVLLDEYQDTSHAQLVLLRALFGDGHPVTAVGDPCQSIYGWRGASAGNLLSFAHHFPVREATPAAVDQLSVSFRNGERILDAAAMIQSELRAETEVVPRLFSGPQQRDRGRVECALFDTVETEAKWIAIRLGRLLAQPPEVAPDGGPGTGEPLRYNDIAVLARKRSQFPLLRRALEDQGIPVEVVGLGGLLTVPEVQDVVATLKVLQDPTAGASLARLLTGPRWRLGPRDLVALGRRAKELAREAARDVSPELSNDSERSQPPESLETMGVLTDDLAVDPLRQVVDELGRESGSLVDALDDPGDTGGFSAVGRARLERLRDELRLLRRQVGLPLPDLVTEVERTLGLDIEVAARTGLDPVTARADLDAFVDAAASFAGDAEDPTLSAFLAYLKAAEEEERGLDAGSRVGDTNSVKLMTMHGAKGLEWPVVVLPGLSSTTTSKGALASGSIFPAKPQSSARWTTNARKLPYPLRGDAPDLPRLAGLEKDDVLAFDERVTERDLREERRLAYVAVTRAKYLIVASGYWWGSATKSIGPSPFLNELREACDDGAGQIMVWTEPPESEERNPLLAEPDSALWPLSPAGERHDAATEGARMVMDAMTGRSRHSLSAAMPSLERGRVSGWARDVELLLAERDRHRTGDGLAVDLPGHLSVSSLVSLARDPAALARQIRRPMPRPPAPYARRGTAFHRWLESRWGQQRLIEPDDLPGAADDGAADDDRLEELQERFEDSTWASREPLDVEVPFETLIADRLVRGRMDAVFRTSDDGYEVVDWKTGSPPSGAEATASSVQLAAYRVAWAQLAAVPIEKVSAAFHYVGANRTVRPVDLLDADGLAALFEQIPVAGRRTST
jgi:DNA helicase II / ATP-dependent DNA helicase PcrA